jgi:hypothetical protein
LKLKWLNSAFCWRRKLQLNSQGQVNGAYELSDHLGVVPHMASQCASTAVLIEDSCSRPSESWPMGEVQRTQTSETALGTQSLGDDEHEDGASKHGKENKMSDRGSSTHSGYCTWDTDSAAGSSGSSNSSPTFRDNKRDVTIRENRTGSS